MLDFNKNASASFDVVHAMELGHVRPRLDIFASVTGGIRNESTCSIRRAASYTSNR